MNVLGAASSSRWRRAARWIGPSTGLAGAVATMTGLALSDYGGMLDGAVNPTTSPEAVARLIAENADRLQTGTTVLMVGLFLLVWFFSYLYEVLNAEGANRWLGSVSTVGGLITVALMALVVAYVRASTQTTFTGSSALVPKTFVVLDWDFWRIFAPFVAAHLLAVGISIVRFRILHPVVGWVAVVLAFLPLVMPPGLMTAVFMLWTGALSLMLLIDSFRSNRATVSS